MATVPVVKIEKDKSGYPAMSEEHVKDHGNHCPKCGSGKIGADNEFAIDGSQAWCEMQCFSCYAHWVDIYLLVGYETEVGNCTDFTGSFVDVSIGNKED